MYETENTSDDLEQIERQNERQQDSNSSHARDKNNNAQRVKSVVVASTSGVTPRTVDKISQRITFSRQSETEEGEISSGENTDNWDSFMENADDKQLADFLCKHHDRIQRVSQQHSDVDQPVRQNKDKENSDENSGETDFLERNIRRLSVMDQEGQIPYNSQSEDTIYTNLVRARRDFKRELGQKQTKSSDEIGQQGSNESQQINSSTDGSFNLSNHNESSDATDLTDKNVVMDKFVKSPLGETNVEQTVVDPYDSNNCISDRSPSPKRSKHDKGQHKKKRTSVEEYAKRKEREMRREEELRERERREKNKGRGRKREEGAKPKTKEADWKRKTRIPRRLLMTHQVSLYQTLKSFWEVRKRLIVRTKGD